MKLVDILARELKVWPDQYYQIYQDSGGNLIGTLSNNDLEDCDSEDLPYDPVTIAWDGSSSVIDRLEWQAAVDALNAVSPSLYIQQAGRCFRALSSDPDDIARAHISNLIYGAMSKLGQVPTVDQVTAAASALVGAGYRQFEIIGEPKS